MKEVYQYLDYKAFLNERLDEMDGEGRGTRARLSRAIGCQTAYTAQVLRGAAHFSAEQAEGINEFLGHTSEQAQYFLLLVLWGRAGTEKLRARLRSQIDELKNAQNLLKSRLGVGLSMSESDQVVYFSSWIYAAVHALVSMPAYQQLDRIAERLRVSPSMAGEALEFLIRAGVVERNRKGELRLGKTQLHLGADSPLIAKHHINWRLQAMKCIDDDPRQNLHYSSVICISRKDEELIREEIVLFLRKIKSMVRESKEEELCTFSMDFFRL